MIVTLATSRMTARRTLVALVQSPLKMSLLGVMSAGPRSTWAFGLGAERWTASGWQVSPTPALRGDLWDGVALDPSRIRAVGQSPVGRSGHGLIMAPDRRRPRTDLRRRSVARGGVGAAPSDCRLAVTGRYR